VTRDALLLIGFLALLAVVGYAVGSIDHVMTAPGHFR
jgi:hypothetical protein